MRFYIRKHDGLRVRVYFDLGIDKSTKLRGKTDRHINPNWTDKSTLNIDNLKSKAPAGEKAEAREVRDELEMFEQAMTLKLIELKRKFRDGPSIREMLQDYLKEYYDEDKIGECLVGAVFKYGCW